MESYYAIYRIYSPQVGRNEILLLAAFTPSLTLWWRLGGLHYKFANMCSSPCCIGVRSPRHAIGSNRLCCSVSQAGQGCGDSRCRVRRRPSQLDQRGSPWNLIEDPASLVWRVRSPRPQCINASECAPPTCTHKFTEVRCTVVTAECELKLVQGRLWGKKKKKKCSRFFWTKTFGWGRILRKGTKEPQ